MIYLRIVLFLAASALAVGAQAQIAFRAASQTATAAAATPAYVASATATVNGGSFAINRPGMVAQNDILIAQVAIKGVQTVTAPTPANSWTLVNVTSTSTAGNQITQAVYWRRVGVIGSEPASYTWSWSSNGRASGAIAAYRNVDPVLNPIDASGVQSTNANSTITLPTITTTSPNAMLVALLDSSRAGNNHSVPTGMTTERHEVSSGGGANGTNSSLDEQLLATAGSTGAKTATSNNAVDNIAHLLALRNSGVLTIAVPAGTVTNDVMTATVTFRPCSSTSGNACTTTITAPAGWVVVNSFDQTTGAGTGGFGHRLFVYRRAVTGPEPASYSWSFGGAPGHAGAVGAILSFSGVDTTNPIVAQAGQVTANAYTHAAPSIDTSPETNATLVSSHSANSSATWTTPTGMTERADIASLAVTNDLGLSLEVSTEVVAAAGLTGTRTATLSNPPASDTGATHVLALRPALTHYSISALSNTVANCEYAEVTITGHNAAHGASNPPSSRIVTLTTSTGTGVWMPTLVGTGVWAPSGLNNGTATYTWPGGESSFTVRLRQNAVASLTVNLNDGFFTEIAAEDPTISFVNSVFRISTGANAALAIGTQIAGKPSSTAPSAQSLFLQAIRTDTTTGACVSLFPSGTDVPVEVGALCNNPATCTQNLALTSSAAASNSATFVPDSTYPATMNFRFTTANAEAPFTLNYGDAGQITLQFRRLMPAPPAATYVQGTSNAFVVRPFGFAFPGITHAKLATASVLAAAGANFSMTVGAYRWAAADDTNNDGIPDASANITDNGLTPNFAAATTVSATGNLPGVATGTVDRASGGSVITAAEWSGGTATLANWRYSEVGNVFLSATSNDYLADTNADVSGNSGHDGTGAADGYVGRFRPNHFALSAGTVTNRSALACASTFTYMNEGLQLGFTLTAQNAQNGTTKNYSGAYAKLGLTTFANWSLGARSGTTNLTSRIDSTIAAPTGSWGNGGFDGVANNVVITTAISRATPDNPDGPYAAVQFGIAPVDSDTTAMITPLDLDVDNNTVNERKNLGLASPPDARFGRLRMQNAVGSEKLPTGLPVPLEVQFWNGAGFATNTLDNCTSLPQDTIVLGGYTGVIDPANPVAGNCKTFVQQDPVGFTAGVGLLTLNAPAGAVGGSLLLTPNIGGAAAGGFYCVNAASVPVAATAAAIPYLLGRWNDGANPDVATDPTGLNTRYDDNPSSRAAFGLYGSQPNNFIYFRENF